MTTRLNPATFEKWPKYATTTYSAEHQMSVQAVCSVCHRRREIERAAAENKLPANAKLDHEKVRTIRSSTEPTRALADALGVDVEMVRRIRTGQTYRSVR